jgi:hypothetical protein
VAQKVHCDNRGDQLVTLFFLGRLDDFESGRPRPQLLGFPLNA